jgi:hypothetical protein
MRLPSSVTSIVRSWLSRVFGPSSKTTSQVVALTDRVQPLVGLDGPEGVDRELRFDCSPLRIVPTPTVLSQSPRTDLSLTDEDFRSNGEQRSEAAFSGRYVAIGVIVS